MKEYYLKCEYSTGMWDDEKWVTINVDHTRHPEQGGLPKFSFFTNDQELDFLDRKTALIRIMGIEEIYDSKWAMVIARETGNPRRFIVPLEDIVERERVIP